MGTSKYGQSTLKIPEKERHVKMECTKITESARELQRAHKVFESAREFTREYKS